MPAINGTLDVGMIRKYIANLPDEAPVMLEYPARYGLKQIDAGPEPIETITNPNDGETDFISGGTVGTDGKRLYIYHHF